MWTAMLASAAVGALISTFFFQRTQAADRDTELRQAYADWVLHAIKVLNRSKFPLESAPDFLCQLYAATTRVMLLETDLTTSKRSHTSRHAAIGRTSPGTSMPK